MLVDVLEECSPSVREGVLSSEAEAAKRRGTSWLVVRDD
jgi:hypothetical protein